MKNAWATRLLIYVVTLATVATSGYAANGDKKSKSENRKTPKTCSAAVVGEATQPTYKLGGLGSIESLSFGDVAAAPESNGYLKGVFATAIVRDNRLPNTDEIRKALLKMYPQLEKESARDDATIPDNIKKMYADPALVVGTAGLFVDLNAVLRNVSSDYPKVYKDFAGEIAKQAFLFFRHRLRPPTLEELRNVLKFEDAKLLKAIITTPGFWSQMLNSDLGRHLDYARKRIKAAYARAVRGTDTPNVLRTRRIQPTIRRLVEVMIMTKSNEHYQWRAFTGDYNKFHLFKTDQTPKPEEFEAMVSQLTEELEAMLGMHKLSSRSSRPEDQWVFDMPVLFPHGIDDVHAAAKAEYQPTFNSYEDRIRFSDKYALHVRNKVVNSPGILVSSVQPGLKIDWPFLDGMIQMSKDKGFPVVIVIDGNLNEIDPELLKNPDIDFLTATIENDEFMLSNLPSKNRQNPFGPYKDQGRYKIGQQIITPHPTLAYEGIPTAHNSQNQTQLYSTGTINLPLIPAVGVDGRTRAFQLAHDMKRAFLVVEKTDKGLDGGMGGVTNEWQIRPVELRSGKNGKPAVFVDKNMAYLIHGRGADKIQREVSPPTTIVIPDVHFLVANPTVMWAIKEYIAEMVSSGTQVNLILPDPIDSKSINGHVEKKQNDYRAVGRMVKSGEISYSDELNDTISNINVVLAEFSNAVVTFQYSNHSDEWIVRHLMNSPTPLQQTVNGTLIEEISFACRMNGWTPLEYLLLHREKFLQASTLDGSQRNMKGVSFISDPSRVRTMRVGEPSSAIAAAGYGQVFLQHHGHQGSNGGQSSFKTHSMGETRSVTGDAHRDGYMARGDDNYWIGVGATAYDQPYTAGGYSSWGVSMAVISKYNTMQLLQWSRYSLAFSQRPEIGPVAGMQFFGDDQLRVVGAMDDDDGRRVLDSNNLVDWFFNQTRWLQANPVRTPAPLSDDDTDTGP